MEIHDNVHAVIYFAYILNLSSESTNSIGEQNFQLLIIKIISPIPQKCKEYFPGQSC